MNIKPLVFLLALAMSIPVLSWGQNTDGTTKKTDLGVSIQAYPAGFIPTINLEHFLGEDTSLLFRLGGNFTDRQDFSDVNVSEEGEGFGGSVGYRKHFPSGKGSFIAGLNLDIWSLNIDWTDDFQESPSGPVTRISGSTYILVLQPWLEGGYFLPIKNTKSQIGLTLGFGREINVITSGDEVAQGFIGSISLQYQFSL
ncbi:hypothetical protein [Flagellimonas allohymeniacidonis]|uniref:Outer membrane protein beta-barrel domain-containing protein n=1 Tax=Flagellimonas allohymeniacidonis TaxID=2517819 RepID=A0A4Q8Q9B0_9FLAO|nr:hypothetical protein [Allomuricauda hymeniacidonis]TAI46842.1 hypothetical protein EW142_09065 [Allomuricauda hymeniacidonis]